jgi:hypothetical protein|tara:strand:- start:865 stop:9018 length:8154 start_codon:yes stop_codon:yes gene_type:complete
MPEIKSAFTRGTMNKDLDERLIPSGHYRDAVNVNVTTSEEGGAGTVRNLLGNTRIDNLVPDSMFCVGSVADERNNKLYWFVFGEDKHAILEYDQSNNSSQIILADTPQTYSGYEPFLNFTGKQITGINIVDNFLFWSDGDNEPKKINISRSFHTNGNLAIDDPNLSPAYLHIDGQLTDVLLNEEHITVIKKKPTSAPTVKLISAKGEAGSAIFEKVFIRFCTRYKYADGEYSAFGPFTDVVFNPEHNELINSANAYSTDEPYNKSMVNLIKSVELYDFISPDMPADVVQVDILYKQEDSTAVYSIENIKTNSAEANHAGSGQFVVDGANSSYKGKYEVTSESIHAVLPSEQLLRPFDVVPKSALGQEIIGNRLVYANYKQGYDFTDSVPTIDAYKINRQSQDFASGGLKSLKSQRKYQLGYVLGDKYGRETPVFTSRQGGVDVPWYSDEHFNASASTMLKAQLYGSLPEWADYYKFYVKSSSDEYYNLLMDRSYFPFTHNEFVNKDDHIYISFPSSDRNKIVEDDYIIAKKIYDSNYSQIQFENKYKILDISNEAPDAVKYVFFSLGSVENSSASNILCTGSNDFGSNSLFPGPNVAGKGGKRIDQKVDTIHMSANGWVSSNVDGSRLTDPDNEYNNDVYISWNAGNVFSERYKVTSIDVSSNNNDYVLKLSTKISEKDAKLAAFNETITSTEFKLNPDLIFRCERRETRGEEDFSGKFFVKIKHNDYLTGNDQSDDVYPVSTAKSFWLFGEHNTTNLTASSGIVNSASSAIANSLEGAVTVANSPNMNVNGFANTAAEWSSIKDHIGNSFFIDDMNFVAGNVTSESYAKESAKITKGNTSYHRMFRWQHLFGGIDGTGLPFYTVGDFAGEELYGWRPVHNAFNTTNLEIASVSWTPTTTSVGSFANNLHEFVNSFEGIVTQTSEAADNRRIKDNSIYEISSAGYYDTVYEDGKHYIHISYLAPGVDLIDPLSASDLIGVTIKGRDSIASKLQGIWGGGAFNKVPSTPTQGLPLITSNAPDVIPFGNLTVDQGRCVEFEGNYADAPYASPGAGFIHTSNVFSPGPGVGQGYDLNYQTRHEQQWNPAFSDNGNDPEIEDFVARLKTPGSKFKFKGDTSNTVYTIQSVREQHVYNHTSWRLVWTPNETSGEFTLQGNSVEEAASDWADFTDANLTPSNNSDMEGYSEAATSLADAITNFGRAHNRRTVFIIELDKNPADGNYDPRFDGEDIDATDSTDIEFITTLAPSNIDSIFSSPTIWETEPQQLTDLNIYYEASSNIPTKITSATNELFAPVGSQVKGIDSDDPVYISEWISATKFKINIEVPEDDSYIASIFQFCRQDDSYVEAMIVGQEGQDVFEISENVQTNLPVGLSWFNCFSFGDGIESDRIRDGYNKMRLSSGARVSAVLEEPFIEEHRTNGLIYSGIYNSNSNLNELNQFIAAEKITKDINPTYGSIQKLFTRNTDLVALCEDRIIKILANKDAVFNADGNPQLVATERVLGQSVPFVGDYGISTHPESFASDTFRAYFTDKQRGAVLRLSMDGLTPISESGMRDYFRDNLVDEANFIGSYDRFNQQYNLTIKKKPVIGSILNDDLSVGAKTTEYFIPTDFITDGTFTQGLSFSGVVQVEDLPLEERTLNQNPTLEGSVTIINHEAIPQFDLVPDGSILIPGVTGQSTSFNNYSTSNSPTAWAFTQTTIGTASQNSNNPFVSHGEGDNKFFINRFSNHNTYYNEYSQGSQSLGILQTPGSSAIDEYDDPSVWTYPDFNIGYSDGNISNVFGDDIQNYWTAPVAIFCQTSTENTPFTPPGQWSKSTSHKGIIFRGTPDNGYFGYIDVPASGFVSGGTSLITEDIASAFTGVDNTTMFNGEEIQITVNFGANNIGAQVQNRVRIELLDGTTPLDPSQLVGGGVVDFNTDDTYTTIGATNLNSTQFSNTPEHSSAYITGEAGGYVHAVATNGSITPRFKFINPNNPYEDGIAVQNLVVRIHVEGNGSLNNASYTSGGAPVGLKLLTSIGETVIKGFRVKKLKQFAQHFTQSADEVTSNGIPEQDIPAWAEVIYPDAIEGFIADGANIDNGLEEQFGPENPSEVIPYTDLDGNQQTYLSGSFNGVTEYSGDASEITVPINHLVSGFNINALLDPNTTLELNKWYMVDIKINQNEGGPNPFIKFVGGSAGMTTYNFFNDSAVNVQIGSYINGSTLRTVIQEGIDGAPVYRALFRLHSNASNAEDTVSQISKLMIGFYDQDTFELNESVIEEVRLIDVSVEATGGSADNWNIDPSLYQIQRAAIPETNYIPQSHPSVYYQDGQINFGDNFGPTSYGTGNIRSFTQQLPDLPEVNDHYELFVVYGNDAISGQNSFQFGHEITINVGDFEYTDAPIPDILYTHGPINFDGGPAEIKFTADNSFRGSVKSVSLKDMTNYFSAGSAGAWIIEGNTTALNVDGEEVTVENFIDWSDDIQDDGQIFFNGATSGSRIYQEVELPVGQTFQLTFDADVQSIPTAGSLKVSYRNASGIQVDQKLIIQSTDGDNLLFEFIVDEGVGQPEDLPNCIIFEAIGEVPLYGTIDNIKLTRIITDEEFGVATTTVSYKESVKGWVSFKSFIPENGLSLSSQYFTFQHGQLWQHDTNEVRNNFYGIDYDSSITTIMNQSPSIVKSFDTVNYEGSEDWMLSQIHTDLDQGVVNEFVKKENKWFNYIKGSPGNFDTSRLNVQGLGFISHTTED